MKIPMQRGRIVSVVGVALLLAAAAGLKAQQAPPEVTFQVEVNYVDVDAIVTDEKGNFVTGLTRDDFEVFEDGKPQKVEMFSYVELPVEPPDRFAILGRPANTDARSNARPFDGRVYVLVMDDIDISPLRTSIVKKSAREFIERHLGANDLAAVVYTSGRTDATQDFTNDRDLLIASVDKFVGRRLQSAAIEALEQHYYREFIRLDRQDNEVDADAAITDTASPISVLDLEREQRALAVLDTLRNLGEFLAGVRGRRKAVLLFSEGLEMPMSELYSLHTPTDVGGAIRDAITAAARSNVNFFALDPRGLIGLTTEFIELAGSGAPNVAMGVFGSQNAQQGLLNDLRLSQDSLRTLAEETGGFAAVNQNTLGSAFERIVDANSRYYVLGYYPPTHGARWPVPPHRGAHEAAGAARVRAARLCLAARPHACRAKARRGIAEGTRGQARRRQQHLARAARRTQCPAAAKRAHLHGPGGPVQAYAEGCVGRAGDRVRRRPAAIHAARQRRARDEHRSSCRSFGINQDGKAQRSTRSQFNLTLRPESFTRVKTGGLRVNPRLMLEPGRYQIRVGARETVGSRVGTVFYDLQVPDFRKEPLMLSGVLVTAASAQAAMTAMADPAAPKLLPGPAVEPADLPPKRHA